MVSERVGALCRRAHGRGDGDDVRVARVGGHFDSVAWGEEGVEPLDEVWVAVEQHRYTFDNAWGVDTGSCVSM